MPSNPLFDDGGVAHGEIYGLEEEMVIDGLRGTGDYDNAMVIIGVSKFIYYTDVPNMAKDAWYFYNTMLDLAYNEYIPYYKSFHAIDRDDENSDEKATHTVIYKQTVDAQFGYADAHTGGDDQTIVFISSHGSPTTHCFYLYDTWWWGHWYGDSNLAGRVKDQTSEGTDMWLWLTFCYSDYFNLIFDYDNHRNHAVYWTYDHKTWADQASVEIPEFKRFVEMYYSIIEIIFNYVNYDYHNIHGGDYYITQHDYLSGYFSLFGV